MNLRQTGNFERTLRALWAPVLFGFLLLGASIAPAEAQILPAGFFDMQVTPGAGGAAVEADRLSYDAASSTISAEGNVLLSYSGYSIRADRVSYDQKSGEMHARGGVVVRDPQGDVYHADKVDVTGQMKKAVLDSMTLDMPDGSKVTATSTEYASGLQTILNDASYSPCGLCIDSKGRHIGWKVKSVRMTYDRDKAAVYFDQPSLELLGIPVLWLPWFWIPDPSQPRASGIRLPSVSYDGNRGAMLSVPYFIPEGDDVDITLSPTLMSRQGFLMRGDVAWRFPQLGEIDVSAAGLYQLDRSAFKNTVGDRDWRGAIQTYGRFTPTKDWTVGWSYSAFTDNQFLYDYANAASGDVSTNQLYATNLTADTYIDARLQHFNLIGNYASDDPAQGNLLPVVKYDHVQDLAPGYGRISIDGKILSIYRAADQAAMFNGVPYVSGYEGNKQHLEIEGAYENQWVLPGGVTATPYLGLRLDATRYDRTIAALPAPYPAQGDASLLAATPIAAMDVRWPLLAQNGDDTHVLEPVLQLVYRGASDSLPGIVNDDAQSFVFDTSNLFSYNKFSGIDRQETGLNANVGAHYLATMADGSWLDLVAGESFHLLGPNAMAMPDSVQVGTSTGLGTTASYLVASATGSTANGIVGNGKIQLDPATFQVTRAGGGIGYNGPWYTAGLNYIYLAKNPALGTLTDEHELGVTGTVTLFDYYTLGAGYTHNIATNSWASVSGSLTYDDHYLMVSGAAAVKPGSYGFSVHLGLKSTFGEIGF